MQVTLKSTYALLPGLTGVKHIGLDEKSFVKGQDDITRLIDLDGARVLEVVPGRSEESTHVVWKPLTEHQRKQL